MDKTIVINLFGGPGSGKSTTASGLFNKLKKRGVNCEYVQEYAKDLVWGENLKTLDNQIHIYGEQHNRIFRLKGKVDIIITDSPPVMGMVYCDWSKTSPILKQLACAEHHRDDVNTLNFFIIRDKPYNPKGRTQTDDEAKIVDDKVRGLLSDFKIDYTEIIGDTMVEENILNEIVKYYPI